jgi:hypothetical protein
MEWLVTAEIISLLAGLLLLFAGENLRRLGKFFNQPIVYIEGLLNSIRIPAGLTLIIAGGWMISVAASYPDLWYLYATGAPVLFFGLLYLFLPDWIDSLSKLADQLLFSTDDFILGARRSIGIVLIVAAVYMYFSANMLLK